MKKKHSKEPSALRFYIAFFLIYLAVSYLPYHVSGLHPFQVNWHFSSNVLGSLFHRYLQEAVLYAIFLILAFYTKRKRLRFFWLTLFFTLLFINISSLLYYYYAQANFQLYVLEKFTVEFLFSYFSLKWIFLILALFAGMLWLGKRLIVMRNGERPLPPLKKQLLALALALTSLWTAYFYPPLYDLNDSLFRRDSVAKKLLRITELDQSGVSLLARELAFVLSPPRALAMPLTEEEENAVKRRKLDEALSTEFPDPPKKIVLIIAESLDQSFISAYNPLIPKVTPFIDRLIDRYQSISAFYPSGPFTIHGLTATLCGHTNMNFASHYANHLCAPELMKRAGYDTLFVRGASKYYLKENLVFTKFGYDRIFAREEFDQKYPDFREELPDYFSTWGFTDDYVLDETLERLEAAEADDRLFITALLVDGHTPGGRCHRDGPSLPSEYPPLVSSSCVDSALEQFIGSLEEKGLMNDDLMIFLTSDQLYPSFTDVPGYRFRVSFRSEPGRVPFLAIGGKDYPLKAKQGSQVDIASTLLDMVNVRAPDYFMGKSLLSNPEPVPLGQDRDTGFMIYQGEFHPLSSRWVDPKKEGSESNKNRPIGQRVQLSTDNSDELMERVRILKEERAKGISEDNILYKWYYNKYHIHDLD